MKLLIAAMSEEDAQKRRRMLHEVFDGYNASSDWPGLAFLDDLLDMYPGAKVILNKRKTPQEWERSVRSSLAFFSTWTYHILTYWKPISYHHWTMYVEYMRLAKRRYGVDDIFGVECYERHNEWVRAVVAAKGKEVLEWEPDDGWTFCKFLGYDVPDEAFPRTNETAEIEKLKIVLVKKGLWAWAGVLGAAEAIAAMLVFALRLWYA